MLSPLFHSDEMFDNMPPMMIHAGECEINRDQIMEFTKKLVRGKNNIVKLEVFQDMCHTFTLLNAFHETGKLALRNVGTFVNNVIGRQRKDE